MWGLQMQKSLTWGVGVQCKGVNFPPHMLRINCPISHKPLAPSFPLTQPYKPTYPQM